MHVQFYQIPFGQYSQHQQLAMTMDYGSQRKPSLYDVYCKIQKVVSTGFNHIL